MDCVTRYLALIPNPFEDTVAAWTSSAVVDAADSAGTESAADYSDPAASSASAGQAAPVAHSALQPPLGPQAGAADLSHARDVAELERLLADNRSMEAFNELAEGDIPLFLRRSA